MAIDKQRLKRFRKQFDALQRGLTIDEFYQVFRAKLHDLLQSRDLVFFKDLTQVQLRDSIRRLFDPQYKKHVAKILRSYDDTVEIINTLYNDIGSDVSRDFKKIQAIEQINRTRLGDYEDDTVKAIARSIRQGLNANENAKQIAQHLKKVDSKVQFFANTIADTQVKAYSRVLKSEKARIGEVFRYEYAGIVRKTTRPFCRALVGSTFHIDEIKQMRNGNLGPVITYCGGWNCKHEWEPDPFAKQSTAADWQEHEIGSRTIKILTPKDFGQINDDYKEFLKKE